MYLIAWEKSLFLKEKPYHLIVQIAKKKTIFEIKAYHLIVQIAKKKDYFFNQNLPPYSANNEKKRLFF